jgi:hypothetical protein
MDNAACKGFYIDIVEAELPKGGGGGGGKLSSVVFAETGFSVCI